MAFKPQRQKAHAGFTLVEVLVAMLIVGLALPALLDQAGSLSQHTYVARNKTQAYWVAQNKLAEISINQRLNDIKLPRKQTDTVELGRDKWQWTVTTTETPLEEMLRVEVAVSLDGQDNSMARLSGFIRSEE